MGKRALQAMIWISFLLVVVMILVSDQGMEPSASDTAVLAKPAVEEPTPVSVNDSGGGEETAERLEQFSRIQAQMFALGASSGSPEQDLAQRLAQDHSRELEKYIGEWQSAEKDDGSFHLFVITLVESGLEPIFEGDRLVLRERTFLEVAWTSTSPVEVLGSIILMSTPLVTAELVVSSSCNSLLGGTPCAVANWKTRTLDVGGVFVAMPRDPDGPHKMKLLFLKGRNSGQILILSRKDE